MEKCQMYAINYNNISDKCDDPSINKNPAMGKNTKEPAHLPMMFSGFFSGTQLTVVEQASSLVRGFPSLSTSMLS